MVTEFGTCVSGIITLVRATRFKNVYKIWGLDLQYSPTSKEKKI